MIFIWQSGNYEAKFSIFFNYVFILINFSLMNGFMLASPVYIWIHMILHVVIKLMQWNFPIATLDSAEHSLMSIPMMLNGSG